MKFDFFKNVSAQDDPYFANPDTSSSGGGFSVSTNNLAGEAASDRFTSLDQIVIFVINLVFVMGLAVALLFVIIGGIKYVTSGGDEGKATEARNTITNAVIGAVVIIAFRIIINVALNVLGFGDLQEIINQANESAN
jgi:ABC-type Fe3+ transport system permease subunit